MSTHTGVSNFQKTVRFLTHPVYICYVDFEKAFDRISWVKLKAILADIEVG